MKWTDIDMKEWAEFYVSCLQLYTHWSMEKCFDEFVKRYSPNPPLFKRGNGQVFKQVKK